jgi:GTPase Era involved in 16S rRNA processing
LGERAAGKSTLCNSIFGKPVFKSGLTLSTNMTAVKQERIHEGKLYIDTPGFAEGSISEQVAKEIEEALKYNNNYKIVFVVKSQGMGKNEIDTINKICNAIQTDFEYGIVFNKFSRKRIQKMNQQGIDQEKLHESSLYMPIKPMKLPSLTVVLEEDEALKDEDYKYFQANDENRKKLLNFLNKLNAHKIAPNKVRKIDI